MIYRGYADDLFSKPTDYFSLFQMVMALISIVAKKISTMHIKMSIQ